jgi:hypothetical protein
MTEMGGCVYQNSQNLGQYTLQLRIENEKFNAIRFLVIRV